MTDDVPDDENISNQYKHLLLFWTDIMHLMSSKPQSLTSIGPMRAFIANSKKVTTELVEMNEDLLALYTHLGEYYANLADTWSAAQKKVNAKAPHVPHDVEQADALKRIWVDIFDNDFTELFDSPKFGENYGKLVSKELEIVKRWNNIANVVLQSVNLPSKEEIDEVYREIHSLKKRLRIYEVELQRLRKTRHSNTTSGNLDCTGSDALQEKKKSNVADTHLQDPASRQGDSKTKTALFTGKSDADSVQKRSKADTPSGKPSDAGPRDDTSAKISNSTKKSTVGMSTAPPLPPSHKPSFDAARKTDRQDARPANRLQKKSVRAGAHNSVPYTDTQIKATYGHDKTGFGGAAGKDSAKSGTCKQLDAHDSHKSQNQKKSTTRRRRGRGRRRRRSEDTRRQLSNQHHGGTSPPDTGDGSLRLPRDGTASVRLDKQTARDAALDAAVSADKNTAATAGPTHIQSDKPRPSPKPVQQRDTGATPAAPATQNVPDSAQTESAKPRRRRRRFRRHARAQALPKKEPPRPRKDTLPKHTLPKHTGKSDAQKPASKKDTSNSHVRGPTYDAGRHRARYDSKDARRLPADNTSKKRGRNYGTKAAQSTRDVS